MHEGGAPHMLLELVQFQRAYIFVLCLGMQFLLHRHVVLMEPIKTYVDASFYSIVS